MRATAEKREQLQAAIAALENQRVALGDLVVDSALDALRRQLAESEGAREAPRPLEGERKLVTIMFCDVSGYTAMAEKLDPERARDLLNACFEHLVLVVQKYGGTIDKFVGDEIMALFGAPIAHEDDAEHACRAALEMMSEITAFNRANGGDLGLHFGMNTGHVVAGGVGTAERQDYSVMGHAVNLAARLEDASSRDEILVGELTQRMTAAVFEFEERTLEVKGASAPVTAFRLLGIRESSGRKRGIAGLHSPCVGREQELARLRALMDSLGTGHGRVAAVIGDAGLGKSRLVSELRQTLDKVQWAEGRSLSHTSGMTYWLARDLLRNVLGFDGEPSAEEEGEILRQHVNELISEDQPRSYCLLARFLEIPLEAGEASAIHELNPEALQRQTGEAVAALLLATALEKPLVLVCEDLHWADPSSLRMLEGLLPLTAHAPLFFLLVLRLETEGANEFLARAEKRLAGLVKVVLEPLSPASSEQLLENLLVVDEVPPELKEVILSKTEGNAFFLEEVLRSLIESGAIAFKAGRAVFGTGVRVPNVPDTVQGVLASRIDRLPPDEKNTLQTAAVLGRIFDEFLLSRIAPDSIRGDRLRVCLQDLVRREMLRTHASNN